MDTDPWQFTGRSQSDPLISSARSLPLFALSGSRCVFGLEKCLFYDSQGLFFRSVLTLRRLPAGRRRAWQPQLPRSAPETADNGPLCEKSGLAPRPAATLAAGRRYSCPSPDTLSSPRPIGGAGPLAASLPALGGGLRVYRRPRPRPPLWGGRGPGAGGTRGPGCSVIRWISAGSSGSSNRIPP